MQQKNSVSVQGSKLTVTGDYAELASQLAKEQGTTTSEALHKILRDNLPEVKTHVVASKILGTKLYDSTWKLCQDLGVNLSEFIRQAVEAQTESAMEDTAIAASIRADAGLDSYEKVKVQLSPKKGGAR